MTSSGSSGGLLDGQTLTARRGATAAFNLVAVAAFLLLLSFATPSQAAQSASDLPKVELTCEVGMKAFCRCPLDIERKHPDLCKKVLTQCRTSFCKPLCLRMAWGSRVKVHCEKAPDWRGCRDFAEEIGRAEKAIAAQFQAHVCSSQLACCRNYTKLVDWVENQVYGTTYPHAALPVPTCAPRAGMTAERHHTMCEACEQVIEVDIDTDEQSRCVPRSSSLKKITPMSLHERCLFMSDMISNIKDKLLRELRRTVCRCAGCCHGGCYFQEKSTQWLT